MILNYPVASRRGIQKEILPGFAASSGVLYSFILIRSAIGIIPFGQGIASFCLFSVQSSIQFVLEI